MTNYKYIKKQPNIPLTNPDGSAVLVKTPEGVMQAAISQVVHLEESILSDKRFAGSFANVTSGIRVLAAFQETPGDAFAKVEERDYDRLVLAIDTPETMTDRVMSGRTQRQAISYLSAIKEALEELPEVVEQSINEGE